MSLLRGSIVAIVTPMKGGVAMQSALDDECFAKLINYHVEHGTEAIVAAGTTGESATLTFEEHCRVIDRAVEFLIDHPEYDSVQTVSEFNMFNPFRSFVVKNNELETYMDQEKIADATVLKNINDKKSAGDIYFANGSFFICRRDILMKKIGKLPFPWLGNKIKPWIQPVTMEIDAYWQSSVLREQA